jgi:teichuronic acid biosynthesis glycosyltransferase TuaC
VDRPVRVLLFSTLYPSSVRPGHGIFVETRLRELMRGGGVEPVVMAPVPWFPSTHPRFGTYAKLAATPLRETWNGIEVLHPRYPLLPKIGMTLAPVLLAGACAGPLRRLIEGGFDFDVIDAHYYYPDGVAAAWLGRQLGKPVTITARGSDLTLVGRYALPRRMMHWAARQASASIGVCDALVDVLRDWGIDGRRLHVMRNGVDIERFVPLQRDECRQRLGVDGGPVLLSVGHLVERKGHELVIDTLALLKRTHPQARLVVVGEGPERARLEARATEVGVAASVRFTGALAQNDLARWYGASDMLVLASSREGWANVLLEAMACGTPVVATRAGGTAEVVTSPDAGLLVDERSAAALHAGVLQLLATPPSRQRVRAYAEAFTWESTSTKQLDLFRALARRANG